MDANIWRGQWMRTTKTKWKKESSSCLTDIINRKRSNKQHLRPKLNTAYHNFCSNRSHDTMITTTFTLSFVRSKGNPHVPSKHFCPHQTPSSIPFWLGFSSQFQTTFNQLTLQAFILRKKRINEERLSFHQNGGKPFHKTSVS